MKSSFAFISLSFLLFTQTLFAAGLDIISKRPIGQLKHSLAANEISVTFNKPAASLNADNQKENTSCPIKIFPAVKGTCRWIGTQTLTFTPSEPLTQATRYTVTVPAGFKSKVDGSALSKNYTWFFETQRPEVVESRPYSGERWLSPTPLIIAAFNMEIPLENFAGKAVLLQGKTEIPVKVSPITEDMLKAVFPYYGLKKENIYVFEPMATLAEGKKYILLLKKGLMPKYGTLGTAADTKIKFFTYGALELARLPEEECLPYTPALRFTNPVTAGEIAKNLTFQPPLSFTPCAPDNSGYRAQNSNEFEVELCGLEFKAGQSYQATLHKDLTDVFGHKLGKDITFTWNNKGYCPNIQFKGGFGVMENYIAQRYPVTSVNVPEIQVERQAVDYKDFIGFTNSKDYNSWCKKMDLKGDFLSSVLKPSAAVNVAARSFIDLAPVLQGKPSGFVFTQVFNHLRGDEGCWIQALDNITGIGVNLKNSPDGILVWATSLKDTKPLKGAEVEIRDKQNNILWQGFTDKYGIAKAPGWQELIKDNDSKWSAPDIWVFVKHGEDIAVVTNDFNEGIQPWRFNLNYSWNHSEDTLKAFTFTDRGIYRQGEKVYIKSVIRALKNGTFDYADFKDMQLIITDARGKEVLDKTLPLNAKDSSVSYEYQIPSSAVSGYWDITLKSGKFETSSSFRVEAVKPAEFEVLLTPLAAQYFSGEKADFALSARYLFGGAMANSPADLTFSVDKMYSFKPAGWDEYSFTSAGEIKNKEISSLKVELDAKGTKNFSVNLPEVESPCVVYAQAGVTSPQNQKLFARKSVTLLPADIFIGVKTDDTMAEAGKPYNFDIAAVDSKGKLVNQTAVQAKLIRTDYVSMRKTGVGGRLEWVNEEKTEEITSLILDISQGKAQWSFTPEKAGSYTLILTAKDAEGRLSSTAYNFYVMQGNAYWKQNDDDLLSLQLDKEEYKPGSKAKLLIKSPYKKAEALITVEREGILDYYIKTVKGGAPTVTIPVKDTYAPNVFISVILVQGRAEEQKYDAEGEDLSKPQAKFGYTVLNVPPKEFELKTSVQAEKAQYRPGQTLKAFIKTENAKGKGVPASVTVFAVDTSMLALTAYKTPDIFEYFYSKRPLSVDTADNRLFVIGQRSFGQKGENRGGGGADAKLGGADFRSNFVFTPYFAASVQTDAAGNGEVSFKLPDNLTKFRLMAVAATKDKFGKAQSEFEVSKPLMIKPLLPRFARAGDKFTCGFILFNYTKQDIKAGTDIKVSGAVNLLEDAPKTVSLSAGGNIKVSGICQASQSGEAVFNFKAVSDKESDALQTKLPVLELSRQEQAFTSSMTQNSEAQKLSRPENTLNDEQNKVSAVFSSTVLSMVSSAAEYLRNYKYNCLEQQMSKLTLYGLAKDVLLALNLAKEDAINQKATAVIESVPAYQASSGGYAYWPSRDYADAFVTAYAIDVLTQAKQNGFAVNESSIEKAVQWLNLYLSDRQKSVYDYSPFETSSVKAYAVYALALAGGNAGGYFSNLYMQKDNLGLEAKIYLLKTAALLKQETALKQLSADIMNYAKESERGFHFEAPSSYRWLYTSDTKVTALALDAFLTAGIDFPQAYKAVQYLNSSVNKDGSWGNTLTNAAVIRAFNTYYKHYESQTPDFKAYMEKDGQNIFETYFKDRKNVSASFEKSFKDFFTSGEELVKIGKTDGSGNLYYSLGLAYYPQQLDSSVSAGFKVEKEIKPLGGVSALKAGQRAEVTITVSTTQDRRFIVLQDYLPAGFEVVDFTLATEGEEETSSDDEDEDKAANPYAEYFSGNPFFRQEIYDDSIAAFADYLPAGTYKFKYTVNASVQGSFKVPPAWVNAMYEPEVYGRTASGSFEIE